MDLSNLISNSDAQLGASPDLHVTCTGKGRRNTDPQKNVLRALCLFGMLTHKEVETATRQEYTGVTRTVKLMKTRGLVSWCRWNDSENDGTLRGPLTSTHILYLTARGHRLAIKQGLTEETTPHTLKTWKGQAKSFRIMPHDRGVIKLMIAIVKGAEKSGRFEVVETRVATIKLRREVNKKKKLMASTADILPSGDMVIPDGYIVLRNKATGKLATLFIEYERDQSRNVLIKEAPKKLRQYHDLFKWEGRLANKGQPLIIYVVPSDARAKKIFTYDEFTPVMNVFRVATYDDVINNAMGSIWLRGVVEEKRFVLKKWSPVHG